MSLTLKRGLFSFLVQGHVIGDWRVIEIKTKRRKEKERERENE